MKTKRRLNVLIACESSGTVRRAFRALGHNAWSCDLLPSDDDSPYHIQPVFEDGLLKMLSGKAIPVHNGPFQLRWLSWDLVIAHPPCTYLCNSGVRWLYENPTWEGNKNVRLPSCRLWEWKKGKNGIMIPFRARNANKDRVQAMRDGAEFFCKLYCLDVPYIAIENPIMHRHAKEILALRLGAGNAPQTQVIQPWQFGHGETKATCLWLRNLPKLVPTDVVAGREGRIWKTPPGPDRWKIRSKTFEGIAKAMATQWSAHIIAERQKGKK
jgi:hypothetical protein